MHVRVRELVVADPGPEAVDQPDRPGAQRRSEQRAHVRVDLVRVGAAVDRVDGCAVVQQAVVAQLEVARVTSAIPSRRATQSCSQYAELPGPSVSTTARPSPRTRAARPGCRRAAAARGDVEPAQRRRARRGPVADPARRAHVVLQHEPLARAVAHEVQARDPDPDAVARAHARHRRLEVVRAVEHAPRQHARGDDPALSVDVGDERVERAHALGEPRRDALPLVAARSRAGRGRRASGRRRRPTRSGCPARRSPRARPRPSVPRSCESTASMTARAAGRMLPSGATASS